MPRKLCFQSVPSIIQHRERKCKGNRNFLGIANRNFLGIAKSLHLQGVVSLDLVALGEDVEQQGEDEAGDQGRHEEVQAIIT